MASILDGLDLNPSSWIVPSVSNLNSSSLSDIFNSSTGRSVWGTGISDVIVPGVTSPLNIDPAPGGGFLSNIDQTINQVAATVANVFNAQAQIEQAKANAAVAKASGKNAVQTARVGLPSPQLMLLGGFGLVAIMLVTSGKRR